LYEQLEKLLFDEDNHLPMPNLIAVEDQHFRKNIDTLKSLSQARAVVMLFCANEDIPLMVVVPSTAKKAITGNGKATKEQVREIVKGKFNISNIGEDESDAVAIAYAALLKGP
jgi:crossover junction endodeoxyribonuclease RuvC